MRWHDQRSCPGRNASAADYVDDAKSIGITFGRENVHQQADAIGLGINYVLVLDVWQLVGGRRLLKQTYQDGHNDGNYGLLHRGRLERVLEWPIRRYLNIDTQRTINRHRYPTASSPLPLQLLPEATASDLRSL